MSNVADTLSTSTDSISIPPKSSFNIAVRYSRCDAFALLLSPAKVFDTDDSQKAFA